MFLKIEYPGGEPKWNDVEKEKENKGKRRTAKEEKKDHAAESNRPKWLLPLICMIDQAYKYNLAYKVGICGLRQLVGWPSSDGKTVSHNSM